MLRHVLRIRRAPLLTTSSPLRARRSLPFPPLLRSLLLYFRHPRPPALFAPSSSLLSDSFLFLQPLFPFPSCSSCHARAPFFSFLLTSSYQVPASYYNQTGRGYPDIAALGSMILIILGTSPPRPPSLHPPPPSHTPAPLLLSFLIFLDNADQAIGGTSASAPIVAGIFTLLNDYSLNADQKVSPLPSLLPYHEDKVSVFIVSRSDESSPLPMGLPQPRRLHGHRFW